jgi:hypothetical protein
VNLQVQLKPPILIAPRFLGELLQVSQVLYFIGVKSPTVTHIPGSKPLTFTHLLAAFFLGFSS